MLQLAKHLLLNPPGKYSNQAKQYYPILQFLRKFQQQKIHLYHFTPISNKSNKHLKLNIFVAEY
jgi:hypothetical protein